MAGLAKELYLQKKMCMETQYSKYLEVLSGMVARDPLTPVNLISRHHREPVACLLLRPLTYDFWTHFEQRPVWLQYSCSLYTKQPTDYICYLQMCIRCLCGDRLCPSRSNEVVSQKAMISDRKMECDAASAKWADNNEDTTIAILPSL